VVFHCQGRIYKDVSEYGAEKNILDLRREEVTEFCRKLHNAELHNLYSSHLVIRVTKLRRIRWLWHASHMGEVENIYQILIGKVKDAGGHLGFVYR
jgi:hypothetical protein